MAEILPTSDNQPHFISSRLLEALGGIKEKTAAGELVNKGAYLWGVEDRDKGFGLFKHVLLVSRVAYALAKELKEKAPDEYGAVDLKKVVETAILHDISKMYAQDREFLPPEKKDLIGLRRDFKEADIETEEVGVGWLRDLGFSEEVQKGIVDHFPEKPINDPYWKIVLASDFLAGQKVTTIKERLDDVHERWIVKGNRMPADVFARARATIESVGQELFTKLVTTDEAFIIAKDLNNPESATRWEKFLMGTYQKKREDAAKRHVARVIGNS